MLFQVMGSRLFLISVPPPTQQAHIEKHGFQKRFASVAALHGNSSTRFQTSRYAVPNSIHKF